MVLNGFYPRILRWLAMMMAVLCLSVPIAHAAPAGAEQDSASPDAAALADMLENDQTRQQLIKQLRQVADGSDKSGEVAQDKAAAEDEDGGLGGLPRQVADTTQAFAESLAANVTGSWDAITSIGDGADGKGADWGRLAGQMVGLAIVIGGTIVAFFLLRRAISPLFRRADAWVCSEQGASSVLKRLGAVLLCLVLDLVAIALAFVVGYALGLFAAGDKASIGTYQSLFINAFAMVEVIKALIRMVFASRYDGLRLFDMDSGVARYWNRFLAILAGLVGYGMMVAVPFVEGMVSPSLARLVDMLIMVVAYVYALTVILGNRRDLQQRLETRARAASMGAFGILMRILGKVWHLFAIGYFTVLLIISQVYPEQALPFMARATLQTLVAVGLGMLISSMITRVLSRRLELPNNLGQRLPQLEQRLNAYVPNALKAVRALLLIAVLLVVMDAWKAFDLPGWMASDAGQHTIGMIIHVAIILLIAALVWTGLASFIEHRLNPGDNGRMPSAREKTLLSLFRNAIAIALAVMTIMIVLSQIGINIGPLIAGAGVVGLAVGFGAQKLVQDVITGVFIQLENAMNTGDVVSAGGITGTAERLTIRSVGIRDLSGTYHVVPFSSVDVVSNYMRDFAYHVGEYGIAYREDVDFAIEKLQDAFKELKEDETQSGNIMEDMTVPGVIALADSSVNIRIMIKTTPGTQWALGRAFNRLVKKHFDAAGIEIPFPHLTMYFGEDHDGKAPPANIRVLQREKVINASERKASSDEESASTEPTATTGRNSMPDVDNDDAGDAGDR
ncbi:mechanosensitive channel protein [Larsenimonas rhizosphaerae]|uniref:mechanosensitive channel protein n=1 Tax=Larsenimonas rhizosphaerae TaxID=2944682 RepID=UPI002034A75E|nr:mechanosensitive channel protein [Larsenimonas rhizosphaerae]